MTAAKYQSLKVLDKLENSILIISLLLKSFEQNDYETKKSVINFMVKYLTNREISKLYRSCKKFIDRTNASEEEFKAFLADNSH